jgi:prolyl-tRNA synthetase
MVRAGLDAPARAPGCGPFLPAGWRVHEKAVQIIREEMNAIGGQEMLMPVLQPAEIWQRAGATHRPSCSSCRPQGRGLLAMTHEEAVTQHVAQVVRSYRQLPFSLYHFQVKERDEPRPRAGLLRTREFIMKDAYT